MKIEDRFLKYVSFDTQSDPTSNTAPSSKKQLELGKYLVEDMKNIGIKNAELNEYGIVYGSIPANDDKGKVIGFIAHMDTAPAASGANIKPNIVVIIKTIELTTIFITEFLVLIYKLH